MKRREDYLLVEPSPKIREMWVQYEKLLKEAVINDHYYGLLKLLEECETSIPHVDHFKKVSGPNLN